MTLTLTVRQIDTFWYVLLLTPDTRIYMLVSSHDTELAANQAIDAIVR